MSAHPVEDSSPQSVLTDALDDGGASLGAVARRMAVSPRTLQRYLAEQGTTWRSERDAARRRRADRRGDDDCATIAQRLGYFHPRSTRRWALDDERRRGMQPPT